MQLPPRVTDRAFARLSEIAPGRALRVAVEGGGCSGFQYEITLADAAAADDLVLEKGLIEEEDLQKLLSKENLMHPEYRGKLYVDDEPGLEA